MNDYVFWVTVILVLISLAIVYSTTSSAGGEPLLGVKKQMVFAPVGLRAILPLSRLDYHRLLCLSWCQLYTLNTALLVAMLVLGRSSHGRTRRIRLGPMNFQPLELIKIALVLFSAVYLVNYYYSFSKTPERVFWTMTVFGGIPAGLIVFQNLGIGLLLGAMAFLITLFGVKDNRMHLGLAAAGAMPLFFAVHYYKKFPFSHPYQIVHIESRLSPDAIANGSGFQVRFGKYAISAGGWFGAGFGRGVVRQNGLPEPSTNFTLPTIGEELDMVGTSVLILPHAVLLSCVLRIACHVPDRYGALLCGSVAVHTLLHIVMHVAVVTGLMLNTGVMLSFISSGGASLVSFMGEIGLVLTASKSMCLEQLI